MYAVRNGQAFEIGSGGDGFIALLHFSVESVLNVGDLSRSVCNLFKNKVYRFTVRKYLHSGILCDAVCEGSSEINIGSKIKTSERKLLRTKS
jgi:hypothetical protein